MRMVVALFATATRERGIGKFATSKFRLLETEPLPHFRRYCWLRTVFECSERKLAGPVGTLSAVSNIASAGVLSTTNTRHHPKNGGEDGLHRLHWVQQDLHGSSFVVDGATWNPRVFAAASVVAGVPCQHFYINFPVLKEATAAAAAAKKRPRSPDDWNAFGE